MALGARPAMVERDSMQRRNVRRSGSPRARRTPLAYRSPMLATRDNGMGCCGANCSELRTTAAGRSSHRPTMANDPLRPRGDECSCREVSALNADRLEQSPQRIVPHKRDPGEDRADRQVLPERRPEPEHREHEELRATATP